MTDWWNRKSLAELDPNEWELLCDGCARCCLHKLEDGDSGEIYFTRVSCRYLDEKLCRCTEYAQRLALVPECVSLDPCTSMEFDWLPSTCAYRLRAHGEPLPDWHPLVSGDQHSVHEAGISVRGKVVSEDFVHPDGYDEHIIHWIDQGSAGAE